MIPRGVWLAGVWYPGSQIFGLKIRITPRILNQIQKYFNPFNPRLVRMMKKTEGRKSRWTVPLKTTLKSINQIRPVLMLWWNLGGGGAVKKWCFFPPKTSFKLGTDVKQGKQVGFSDRSGNFTIGPEWCSIRPHAILFCLIFPAQSIKKIMIFFSMHPFFF